MNKPKLVIAIYRVKPGKLPEAEPLIRKHFPTLKEFGLTTDKEPFIGRSSDGTILEIFEWANADSAEKAHKNLSVGKIWEAMSAVCDFGHLEQLPEAKNMFPNFAKF